jgi:hypothetical protein
MKKIEIVLALFLLSFFSCSSSYYSKLRLDIPVKATLDLQSFNKIIVTNFLIKKETKDIDLNKELVDYFANELGLNFKEKVSEQIISLENEGVFEKEDFWKNLPPDLKNAVLLTGDAQYTEEVRKAILEKKKSRFEDPFPQEKSLAERKVYTLNLDLYLIDTGTGKILYKRNFKELKGYENPKQTAYFAFFDLIQSVKAKFFSNILGDRKIQERYLISQ